MAARTIAETQSIYTSRVFTFIVGQEKIEFSVHEKLIAPHSEYFRAMFGSGMREAQESRVVLDDIDPVTFVSFLDFATYGDYEFPRVRPLQESSDVAKLKAASNLAATPPTDSLVDHLTHYTPRMIYRVPYLFYMNCLVEAGDYGNIYAPPLAHAKRPEQFQRPEQFNPELDFGLENREFAEVCLHHVKMYIFGDRFDIPGLRKLALNRTHSYLVRVKLCNKGYNLLFDLIGYAFSNTVDGDQIRRLFTQMCVADLSEVRGMRGFGRLTGRLPEVAMSVLLETPKYWEEQHKAIEDIRGKFL